MCDMRCLRNWLFINLVIFFRVLNNLLSLHLISWEGYEASFNCLIVFNYICILLVDNKPNRRCRIELQRYVNVQKEASLGDIDAVFVL